MASHLRSSLSWRFILLNVIGGTAVLASYVYGFARLGEDVELAWGGVPELLRPWYVRSMFLAAAGYFPMTYFVLVHAGPSGRMPLLETLYAGILVGSALWMPLTCLMIENGSTLLWWLIRLDLAVVGVSAVAVLAVLLVDGPLQRPRSWILAVIGALAFCLQTTVLDALVWPAYFP